LEFYEEYAGKRVDNPEFEATYDMFPTRPLLPRSSWTQARKYAKCFLEVADNQRESFEESILQSVQAGERGGELGDVTQKRLQVPAHKYPLHENWRHVNMTINIAMNSEWIQ
jgi:hypothetical protein